ncbi:MAG: F0F1 ATP synthase subunit A [Oscillospiraceae bacterium]|jgi:F-type H+-transporting ATPase subunit a|nr:F0F1 ATP synthase subunit A [Oscillospiraceae bacterium]
MKKPVLLLIVALFVGLVTFSVFAEGAETEKEGRKIEIIGPREVVSVFRIVEDADGARRVEFFKKSHHDEKGNLIDDEGVVFKFNLTTSVTAQWVMLAIAGTLFFILGRNLKVVPTEKRQILAEWIVGFFRGMVKDGMGEKYLSYAPYIGGVFCLSMFSSLSSLLGMRSPTADISIIAGWGTMTFILVQINKFKTGGVIGAGKSLLQPVAPLLPINLLSEITNPLSQTFRHFGNILAGTIIMGVIYFALHYFAILLPAVLSLYFDIFGAVIQAYVFTTLITVYVSGADCSALVKKKSKA